jgi:FlgD Ig-like domain
VTRLGPTLLVVALLAATATAFAITEHLKLEDSPLLGTKIDHLFSPVCKVGPGCQESQIRFRLRREEEIRLDMADASGTVVRHAVGSGVFPASSHLFAWDGRDDSGRVVPDGSYQAQLRLVDEGRTFEFPEEIRVDATAPRIDSVQIKHRTFSPDGDGRADRVDLDYRFSEPAYSVLYLDGKRLARSHMHLPVGTRQWYGRGKPPGEYRLALAAQDLAGNLAPSTREFTVHLRYVTLYKHRFRPRGPRLRLRVSADAKAVRWRLGRRKGTGRPPRLTLPVPRLPGLYRLIVRVGAHRDVATVVVGRRRR